MTVYANDFVLIIRDVAAVMQKTTDFLNRLWDIELTDDEVRLLQEAGEHLAVAASLCRNATAKLAARVQGERAKPS